MRYWTLQSTYTSLQINPVRLTKNAGAESCNNPQDEPVICTRPFHFIHVNLVSKCYPNVAMATEVSSLNYAGFMFNCKQKQRCYSDTHSVTVLNCNLSIIITEQNHEHFNVYQLFWMKNFYK